MENKLQEKIGAIKNIIIQLKLRLLNCWQQAGNTDCGDEVGCKCKKTSNEEFLKLKKERKERSEYISKMTSFSGKSSFIDIQE